MSGNSAIGIGAAWSFAAPFVFAFIRSGILALVELRKKNSQGASRLLRIQWLIDVRDALNELPLAGFVLLLYFPINTAATAVAISEHGKIATFIVPLLPFACAVGSIFIVYVLKAVLTVNPIVTYFHRRTGYRFKRVIPADHLITLIKEFSGNKSFRFYYRLRRVDDARGGLWGTDDLLRGLYWYKLANLWELERYHLALKWTIERHPTMGSISDQEIDRYKQVVSLFEKAAEDAREMVQGLKSHDRIIDEIDVMSKQVKIAFWSAMGSIASAVATVGAAAIAYLSYAGK